MKFGKLSPPDHGASAARRPPAHAANAPPSGCSSRLPSGAGLRACCSARTATVSAVRPVRNPPSPWTRAVNRSGDSNLPCSAA